MPRKLSLLYLEDAVDWNGKIKELLNHDYAVDTAFTLKQAKELIDERAYHLAIVDTSLVHDSGQDRKGFEFIEYLRRKEGFEDFPVIVLSGYDKPSRILDSFREYKVYDFVQKHYFDPHAFKRVIKEAIDRRWRYAIRQSANALVIEDDPDWQEKLAKVLRDEGCEVDIAGTYGEAIDKLSENSYQLATVDINLKDTDASDQRGIVWADMKRRLNQPVPIIFISGYADRNPEMYKAAFEQKAEYFIDKGHLDPVQLRRRVRDILSRTIYVGMHIEHETPVLQKGQKYQLSVFTDTAPAKDGNGTISIARPIGSGRFDLDIVVQPFDLDVFPGSSQSMTVYDDDTSEALQFEIVPIRTGTLEAIIDVMFRGNMLARSILTRNVEEQTEK